ncbi:hypothetical protein ACU4GH_39815 [Bradyrhizobium betae]
MSSLIAFKVRMVGGYVGVLVPYDVGIAAGHSLAARPAPASEMIASANSVAGSTAVGPNQPASG